MYHKIELASKLMEKRFQQAESLKADTVTCIPRLRAGGERRPRRRASAGTAGSTTPVSVLDRLRDVLLRLAMLSAKSTSRGALQQQAPRTLAAPSSRAASSTSAAARMSPSPTTYPDSYRSEAVDDCIEFLKRSAAGGGAAPAAAGVTSATSPLHASAACLHVPCHVNRS